MFGSEEAVDKALEFGVREFGQFAVAILISLARLLHLKQRTPEQRKMVDAFFSGVQKGADKLCVVPLQGKTRALGQELPGEGQPWSYLLCCPFRYALLLDTYDTIRPEPRKQLLLRRAQGIAAGLHDEWARRMPPSKNKQPKKPHIKHYCIAPHSAPWLSAFQGAAVVRSVFTWIGSTTQKLYSLWQSMLSASSRAEVVGSVDGATLRNDLRASLQAAGPPKTIQPIPQSRPSPRGTLTAAGDQASPEETQGEPRVEEASPDQARGRTRKRKATTLRCPDPDSNKFYPEAFRDFPDLVAVQRHKCTFSCFKYGSTCRFHYGPDGRPLVENS